MSTYRHIQFWLLLGLFMIFSNAFADGEKSIQAKINKVVRTAESYIGTPHVWGGMSKKGIDCSALMKVSFAAGGIELPRNSRQQATVGKAVRRRDLRRGDLIFFKINGAKISHTGLVTKRIGNDVEFIHTSSSRGVMKSRLNEKYWTRRYSNGRRVWKGRERRQQRPPIASTPPPRKADKAAPQTDPVIVEEPREERPPSAIGAGQFPQGSSHELKRKTLKRMSDSELTLVSMEIYARNGYIFPTPKARKMFEDLDWYQAIPNKTSNRRKLNRRLSLLEKSNLKRIRKELSKRIGS
ncbi:MAG: NlpC/P60 family protein [Bacteroidia bacterium]|nr:NlpC/P60 family protein [Bacteroidia bacterium]